MWVNPEGSIWVYVQVSLLSIFTSLSTALPRYQDTKLQLQDDRKTQKNVIFPFGILDEQILNTNNKERAGLCKILVVAKQMAFAKFVRAKYLTF